MNSDTYYDREARLDKLARDGERMERFSVRLSDEEEEAERAGRELHWRRCTVRAAQLNWTDAELDAIYAAAKAAGVKPAQFIRDAVTALLSTK